MAVLLNIDTATTYAGVCISNNDEVLALAESRDQKNHGAFIQPAIQELFSRTNLPLHAIDGIVVSAGPGSYTGLRVGLSTAKGLCYALGKPLIMVNTLDLMAYAAIAAVKETQEAGDYLFCPMIDARRMEVFTALYDNNLNYVLPPSAIILTNSYIDFFSHEKPVVFSGNGSNKFKNINKTQNALFVSVEHSIKQLAVLGISAFTKQRFADLAYSEPCYIKEFFDQHSTV